jgi:hypothetical protein
MVDVDSNPVFEGEETAKEDGLAVGVSENLQQNELTSLPR